MALQKNSFFLARLTCNLIIFLSAFLFFSVDSSQNVWDNNQENNNLIAVSQEGKQQTRLISGRVTDVDDHIPIPNVSVFIAGTRVGTTTDLDGSFQLNIPGEGSYQLTFSHVGYQPLFKDIEPGTKSMIVDVVMNILEFEEVSVVKKVAFRKKDVNLFWTTLLGKKPTKSTIYALNPESVYYYYNAELRKLTVTCREPLEIINNESGYHIKAFISHFSHDYNKEETSWKIEKVFSELVPKDSIQHMLWENNRKKIYQVSLSHFIRALYHNRLLEEGYLLIHPSKAELSQDFSGSVYQNPLNILSPILPDGGKELNIPSVATDQKGLMLICFGKPVNRKEIMDVESALNEDIDWSLIGLVINIFKTAPDNPVRIYADGTFNNKLQLYPWNHSKSLLGLNMMLPSEYIPEIDSKVSSEMTEADVLYKSHFDRQLRIFPQEKIYLHTDKPYYISGEHIWFRAHLVDAVTHIPFSASQYVYVELINPLDSVVTRVKVRKDEGAYHGYLPIPDSIPEGDYTLRAYTTFMRSQDENYFFTKTVYIGDTQASTSQPSPKGKGVLLSEVVSGKNPYRKNSRIPKLITDFDVSFYPEGGSLLEGTFCKVSFKAMKADGQAIEISGIIYDQDGNEVREIRTEHLGMGSFRHVAEKDKTYYAVCMNNKGQMKRFDLPVAKEKGVALAVNSVGDKLFVKAQKPAGIIPDDEFYLFVHTRGIVHLAKLSDNEKDLVVFQKEMFPSGVLHFMLFNSHMNPVSERLAFINNDDQAMVSYQHDAENFTPRSLVRSTVTVTDQDGDPLTGNFSVSVTSDREVMIDSTTNILTQLLLTSDLRGHIENPAYYFRKSPESDHALDLLMLTQGWRRYDMAKVAKGQYTYPSTPIEDGSEISGTVKRLFLGRPVENAEVTLLSHDGYYDKTKTGKDGRFSFDCNMPDSTRFIVSVVPKKGNTRMELTLDEETFPKKTIQTIPPAEKVDRTLFAKYADKAERKYTEEHGMRMFYLSEVTVSAQQKKTLIESPYYFSEMLSPSSIITEEQINKLPGANMYLLLIRVPGLSVMSEDGVHINKITIRGATSINFPPEPLYVIDGIMTDDLNELNAVIVSSIAQIDVLKGAETAAFGIRGAGGVICIYTKRGENSKIKDNQYHIGHITPLGFQQPTEFYAPKYETPENRQTPGTDLRTTIHWQPIVKTDSNGIASFEFYTADETTSYSVIIEGVANDGRIIRKESRLWKNN